MVLFSHPSLLRRRFREVQSTRLLCRFGEAGVGWGMSLLRLGGLAARKKSLMGERGSDPRRVLGDDTSMSDASPTPTDAIRGARPTSAQPLGPSTRGNAATMQNQSQITESAHFQ